jgi:hypothetical protein
MKIFNYFIVFSLMVFGSSYAAAASKKAVAKGIPYCSRKITRGCVKPKPGQYAKYYSTPKYTAQHKNKTAKHSFKAAKRKVAAAHHPKSNKTVKGHAHSKKIAKNSEAKYHKNKDYKRDLASVLAARLKAHNQKK